MRSHLPALVCRLLVALTAAALVSLTLVAPAQAVTMKTWSRLAKCESGGRWHVNTGNGYSGGLQISHGTWRAYGGKKYAGAAARASKKQQVRIAKKIKNNQGWGAWPACSRKLGLRGTPAPIGLVPSSGVTPSVGAMAGAALLIARPIMPRRAARSP